MVTSKPFLNKTNWTKYEIIKTILMTITGISIARFILFFLFIGFLLLSLSLTHCFYSFSDINGEITNFSKLRRFMCFFNQIFARMCLFILGYYYINETFEEKDNNFCNYFTYYEGQNKPKIVILNHISVLDSLYFLSKGSYYFLATAGLLEYPIIGRVLKNVGAIFVPRNDKEKSIFPNPNTIIESFIKNKNLSRPLLLAPEGTTHQNNYLFNFQLGAFRPMTSIQPVLLDFQFKHLDPSWTYSCSPIYTIFGLCCQFINYLDVKNLKVQVPNDEENPELFKNRVEQLYLNSNTELVKVDLSVSDNYYFKKLYKENSNMAIFAYDNCIKKSIAKHNLEEKNEIEIKIKSEFNNN
jgi:lysophosphatidylcholine acyltransferase/lyso-PAF acetyltransferase